MKKYVLSILSIFICVSSMAGLPSDTTYYYYHDNTFDSMIEKDASIDDEVIMIVSEGNKKSCIFYGTSDEFSDDPREGFLPGFIVVKATSLSMENGKFTCVLNSTNHKYANRPIDIGLDEEIPNGYKPWLQFNDYFWNQIELVGTFDSEKIELFNKTFYPEDKKVFRKKSSSSIKALYNKNLLSDSEAESNSARLNDDAVCETDSSLITPFYFNGERDQIYRIADTQTIPDMGSNQYAVSWYVDTEEWAFDPQTNHIFSKIEFKKGDTVLASFCDDDGWSYIGIENSKAKMFKSFRIDSAHTAVVFRGGAYAAGVPFLSVFVLSDNEVKLVFNKEYFIEKIENGKVFIKSGAEKPVCGYLSFMDGHVSIVSNEYPTGKIIF